MYVKVAARCYAAMLPPGGGGVHILWQTRQQLLSSDRTCPGAGGDKSVPIRRTRDHCLLSPPDYWWHPLITTLAALWLSWQFWRVKEIKRYNIANPRDCTVVQSAHVVHIITHFTEIHQITSVSQPCHNHRILWCRVTSYRVWLLTMQGPTVVTEDLLC